MPYIEVWRKFFDFSGRAGRKEYWLFYLIHMIVAIMLSSVDYLIGYNLPALLTVYFIASIIPTFAVLIRRLHDTGRSGWWLLLGFVPFGGIVILVFTLLGSDGPNDYGLEPD